MPITRKLLAQDENEVNQWLKVDHNTRYIVNDTNDWQFLFGPNSTPSTSGQILKLAAQLDTNTLDKIRIIGYLYNPATGSIDSLGNISFKVYRVADITTPKWDDELITTLSGTLQSNSYYFVDISISALTGANLDGETTLMIEGVGTRLSSTYRDRIYVNHLGVYQSVIQLRQDVDFLNITKKDL